MLIYTTNEYNTELTEVYIVPVEFNPNKINPNTGLLQEPTITFDGQISTDIASGNKSAEEIEIYEFQEMFDQVNWFKQNFPIKSDVDAVDNYPALISNDFSCE